MFCTIFNFQTRSSGVSTTPMLLSLQITQLLLLPLDLTVLILEKFQFFVMISFIIADIPEPVRRIIYMPGIFAFVLFSRITFFWTKSTSYLPLVST